MAELKRLLEHRRTLDSAQTVEYDGEAFREAAKQESEQHGKEVNRVAAFRSGWTANPKFHEWQRPTASGGPNIIEQLKAARMEKRQTWDSDTPSNVKRAVSEINEPEVTKMEKRQTSFDVDALMHMKKSATDNQEMEGMATAADFKASKSMASRRSEEVQRQQKQRLDKLLEFANAENERLNKLISEAHGDYDQQSEQLQKLMASKASTERVLDETKRQKELLVVSLKQAEAERDAARAENVALSQERECLEGLVSSAKEENARLESVVASVSAEKQQLEVIAEQKARLEEQLNEARTASAQLAEKAKRAERLERIRETGEAEQARLERLLAESTGERDAVLRQREALDAKVKEVVRHNAQLQEQLKVKDKVEHAVKLLEEENVRLQQRAEASEKEKERLEEVLVKTSDHNQKLQEDLHKAAERYADLENRTAMLEQERDQLLQRPQVQDVEARIEAVKREAQEAHNQAAQEMSRHSQECKERVVVMEREKEALRQELDRTRVGAEANQERVSALVREREEVQCQLEKAKAGAEASEARAIAMEQERDTLRQQLADLAAGSLAAVPEEAAVVGVSKLGAGSLDLNTGADGLEAAKEDSGGSPGPHNGSLMRQLVEAEEARAAEAADRIRLAQKLDEALRHNAELQQRIDKELQAKPKPAAVQPAPAPEGSPAETDFSKILDNWLSALDDAQTGKLPQNPQPSSSQVKQESSFSSWMGSFFGGPASCDPAPSRVS